MVLYFEQQFHVLPKVYPEKDPLVKSFLRYFLTLWLFVFSEQRLPLSNYKNSKKPYPDVFAREKLALLKLKLNRTFKCGSRIAVLNVKNASHPEKPATYPPILVAPLSPPISLTTPHFALTPRVGTLSTRTCRHIPEAICRITILGRIWGCCVFPQRFIRLLGRLRMDILTCWIRMSVICLRSPLIPWIIPVRRWRGSIQCCKCILVLEMKLKLIMWIMEGWMVLRMILWWKQERSEFVACSQAGVRG